MVNVCTFVFSLNLFSLQELISLIFYTKLLFFLYTHIKYQRQQLEKIRHYMHRGICNANNYCVRRGRCLFSEFPFFCF